MSILATLHLIPEMVPVSSILLCLGYLHSAIPIPEWNGNVILWDLCPGYVCHMYPIILLSEAQEFFFLFSHSLDQSTRISKDVKKTPILFPIYANEFPLGFLEFQLNSSFSHKSLVILLEPSSDSATQNCQILWYSAHRSLPFNDKFYSWILIGPILTVNCF